MTELLIDTQAELETRRQSEIDIIEADRDLERRVLNFLVGRNLPGIRRLEVEAHGGTITLRGQVGSFYQKQLCAHCSQRVAGVIRVVNAVQVVAWPGEGKGQRTWRADAAARSAADC